MTDEYAIEGEVGAYVPCLELAAPLVADEEGAIFGIGTGFVARGQSAAAHPTEERAAIVGSGVGFVPKPCAETFMVVGREGKMATSPDGVDWTAQSPGFFELGQLAVPPDEGIIREVAWSSELGLWIAVGAHARLATSPDGVTWTHQNSGYAVPGVGSVTINSVVWVAELGLFVIAAQGAVGNANLRTSPDGVTWTEQVLDIGTTITYLAWSPELALLVAVAEGGGLATSPDAVNWTVQTSSFSTSDINAVAWSSELGLFVAVGGNAKVATSPDGINWTQQTSPFTVDNILDIAWSPALSLWVIVAGWTAVGTSPDGINWTLQPTGLLGGAGAIVGAVVWSSTLGLFLMAGNKTGSGLQTSQVATSSNGASWTYQPDAQTEIGFHSMIGAGVGDN